MNMRVNDSGSSSLKYGEKNEHVKNASRTTVKTIRLDTWRKENNVAGADFIWMDVQGAEREVVEGGREFMSASSYVWTEYGEMTYEGAMNESKTISLFESMGFAPFIIEKENILFGKHA